MYSYLSVGKIQVDFLVIILVDGLAAVSDALFVFDVMTLTDAVDRSILQQTVHVAAAAPVVVVMYCCSAVEEQRVHRVSTA